MSRASAESARRSRAKWNAAHPNYNRDYHRTHPASPEYNVWAAIIQRCTNPNCASFYRYGGRGITMCERWRKSFKAFLSDVGHRPSPEHTIERLNNADGYHPRNCVWVHWTHQGRNTRVNHRLTLNGRTQCIAAWAEETGLSPNTITYRLKKGWSVEKTLTAPTRPQLWERERKIRKERERER